MTKFVNTRYAKLTLGIALTLCCQATWAGVYQHGTVVRMRMVDCLPVHHGFMVAMGGASTQMNSEVCPEYTLVSDKVVFVIVGKSSDQLFFDFAGYSHVAIGAARAFGITLPENFNRPFASTNPSVFWTRWHMSLSFWIRHYVFFPLAPMRRDMWWRHLALALSMIVFGLWHKATVLFLIWGCYHGVRLVSQRLLQQVERRFSWQLPKLWTPLSWIATAALISLGWILFRANSMPQARQMLAAVASPGSYASHYLSSSLYLLIAVLAAGYRVVLLVSNALDRATAPTDASRQHSEMLSLMSRSRWFWLPAVYALALLVVVLITLTQQGGVGQMMYRSL
jgi:hypothetical protein